MKLLLLLFVTAVSGNTYHFAPDGSLIVNSTVVPKSTNKRVTIECLDRDVVMKFTPLPLHQGKLAIIDNLSKKGCFKSDGINFGAEVVLKANFKECTNKQRTFEVRIIEKYKGDKKAPDYNSRKGTFTSSTIITCPPFPLIKYDIRFRSCNGVILRLDNNGPVCYENE